MLTQFIGNKPIFISSRGEIIQKTNSDQKRCLNNWFKGNLEGIKTEDLNNILIFKKHFCSGIFVK